LFIEGVVAFYKSVKSDSISSSSNYSSSGTSSEAAAEEARRMEREKLKSVKRDEILNDARIELEGIYGKYNEIIVVRNHDNRVAGDVGSKSAHDHSTPLMSSALMAAATVLFPLASFFMKPSDFSLLKGFVDKDIPDDPEELLKELSLVVKDTFFSKNWSNRKDEISTLNEEIVSLDRFELDDIHGGVREY
jgi:hypothetical protein